LIANSRPYALEGILELGLGDAGIDHRDVPVEGSPQLNQAPSFVPKHRLTTR
jgi:hypothetical protein